jgi:hypothetical protein
VPTGLTINEGSSLVSTELPPSSGFGRQEESQRSISVAMTADGAGTAAVETTMAPPVQSVQKTGPRLEKWFLDQKM